MRFYTHIAGAILFFLLFTYLLNLPQPFIGIIFTIWISIFPDIIDKFLKKHRGIGHSLLWIFPMLMVGLFSVSISAGLIIGFITHIFLDIFTTTGCPLLYPLKKTSFVCLNHKRRIKTGTNQDKSVFIFIIFLIFPLIFFSFFSNSLTSLGKDNYFEVSASKLENNNTSPPIQNYITLNFRLDEVHNKNISVEKVNDNLTTIMVKDLPVTITTNYLLFLQIQNPNQSIPRDHG